MFCIKNYLLFALLLSWSLAQGTGTLTLPNFYLLPLKDQELSFIMLALLVKAMVFKQCWLGTQQNKQKKIYLDASYRPEFIL